MALTVLIISSSYSRIIEEFPSGGGGYLVASKLLGERAGVISGCALLVDYVLTISISIASGVKAVFAFLPAEWQAVGGGRDRRHRRPGAHEPAQREGIGALLTPILFGEGGWITLLVTATIIAAGSSSSTVRARGIACCTT